MFRVAQWIVRHKVLVVGIACAGFMFAGGNKKAEQPSNPWASNPSTEVAVVGSSGSKKSFTDRAIGAVNGVTKEYVGVDLADVKDKNDANWSAASDATKKAAQ